MQILASALPGLREIRGPVIAGYLWLGFGWLVTAPDLDERPAGTIAGSLYDLAQEVGAIGTAVAVSVAAYLVGALSQEVSGVIRAVARLASRAWNGDYLSRRHPRVLLEVDRRYAALRMNYKGRLEVSSWRILDAEFRDRMAEAYEGFERELELPATLLVAEKDQLFAEADRLRSEGELRIAVVPPLLAIDLILAIEGSWFWLLALPCIGLLARQGLRREGDSRKVIADAIDHGVVKSSTLRAFEDWSTSFLDGAEETLQAQGSTIEDVLVHVGRPPALGRERSVIGDR